MFEKKQLKEEDPKINTGSKSYFFFLFINNEHLPLGNQMIQVFSQTSLLNIEVRLI